MEFPSDTDATELENTGQCEVGVVCVSTTSAGRCQRTGGSEHFPSAHAPPGTPVRLETAAGDSSY